MAEKTIPVAARNSVVRLVPETLLIASPASKITSSIKFAVNGKPMLAKVKRRKKEAARGMVVAKPP
jgi:hypothetical protein